MTRDRILVTGGLGFIGSVLVRRLVESGADVINVDALTYAGDPARLADVEPGRVTNVRMDVSDPALGALVTRMHPDVIVHAAAATHVTRSETAPGVFYRSNVLGTRNVFEAAVAADARLFVHISTDEVYGPCYGAPFKEEDKVPGEGLATSAYARSKALADDLARSFGDRVPVVVVRPTNCFGPWQHPEKAIARWITRALRGERIPVWGHGRHVRDWMYVADACAGIETVIEKGVPGEVYNVAPEGRSLTNVETASTIARLAGAGPDSVVLTAYDRPAHDERYAIDAARLRALGWAPSGGLEERLSLSIDWYREHRDWWEPLIPDAEGLYDDAAEGAGL